MSHPSGDVVVKPTSKVLWNTALRTLTSNSKEMDSKAAKSHSGITISEGQPTNGPNEPGVSRKNSGFVEVVTTIAKESTGNWTKFAEKFPSISKLDFQRRRRRPSIMALERDLGKKSNTVTEASKSRSVAWTIDNLYFTTLEQSWSFCWILFVITELLSIGLMTLIAMLPGVTLADSTSSLARIARFDLAAAFASSNVITMGFGPVVPVCHNNET